MKSFSLLFLCLWAYAVVAQTNVPIYEKVAPGSESWTWKETYLEKNEWQTPIVYNISQPMLEVYKPDPLKANGTGIIIAPGGAFMALSINSEGRDVAKYLIDKGVTCFVLKYRLMHATTDNPISELNAMMGKKEFDDKAAQVMPLAIADGKAALAYVRKNAASFGLAPNRIGIMGFSAGGTVAGSAAFNFTVENRPNFVGTIYPFLPGNMTGKVDSLTPPLFISVASNDNLGLAPHSFDLYGKWMNAKQPAEMHAYALGGHGFGMRKQNLPSDSWIDRFSEWLDNNGYYKPYDFSLEEFERKSFLSSTGNNLGYRILYPDNYNIEKKYPLVVFLHGSGERGWDNEAQLTHGAKLFLNETNRKNYPAIVIFPQSPQNSSWNSMVTDRSKTPPLRSIDYAGPATWPLEAVNELIKSEIENGTIDPKRIYLSGLSMGGFGTFEMAYRYPELFAAAAPICGGGDVNGYDKRVKNIPFWIFHGDADAAVDVKYSREMVEKLKKIGAKVKYSEYPGVGHNSWDNAFAEAEFLKWMFAQKK